jgi:hypothetical protein
MPGSLKQIKVLHKSSLPSTGPDSGELLAATNTKMSTQELEAPSGFRYVYVVWPTYIPMSVFVKRSRCGLAF